MKKSNVTCGKRKAVDFLYPMVDFTQACQFGPYMQVKATLSNGDGRVKMKGWGLARLGEGDTWNREIGEKIAKQRAVTAIVTKLKGKVPHHPLMA